MQFTFSTHTSKSHLGKLVARAYYVKENEAHGYTKVCLTDKVALLAPEGLLESRNNVGGWKAIIRQLEDQLAAGEVEPEVAAAQAAGLTEFANQVLKTPYATTLMRATGHRMRSESDDKEVEVMGEVRAGGIDSNALQRLEDSVGHLRGELGVCAEDACYLTLHGGIGALGEDLARMQQEVATPSKGLLMADIELDSARDKAHHARSVVDTLGHKVNELGHTGTSRRAIEALYRELQDVKAECGDLEATVLTLTLAVTSLMASVAGRGGAAGGGGASAGLNQAEFDQCLQAQEEAVNRRLDSIYQEIKGGGITIGGVNFSGREVAIDWAHLHLPPNTYQYIGGMVYVMCLILEAVIHQEDMMKREEHREGVKRTFMQSAQVLLVHTFYPPCATAHVAEW
jgi:hypothetical protein